MSNIVMFETKPITCNAGPTLGPAEVIIFPGVRYERESQIQDTTVGDAPKRGKKFAGGKSSRAT